MLVIFSWSYILEDCILVKKKELENRCLVFTSSTNREIRKFHVVVVQRGQRNVWKKRDARDFWRQGSKGWRSGESARLPPAWLGFKSAVDAICELSIVAGFLPCSERFFTGYSGFPLSSKPNSSKFQFDQESGRDEEPLCGCATSKSLFII